jgi:MEDS: MEthanogen/methylotroph, DcmR Sensory domain
VRDHPDHTVHFYGKAVPRLAAEVGRYLWEGLKQGEAAIVIATGLHWQAFVAQLAAVGLDASSAECQGRLVFRDAEETLAQFMVRGQPDWQRFRTAMEAVIENVRARTGNVRIRAYGEMVDLLWNAGQSGAAARLEEFWNKLLTKHGFTLYCAYQIDIFGKEFHISVLDSVLCSHSHVQPTGGNLEGAVDRALGDVLGGRADGMKELMQDNFRPAWAAIPKGEAKVLWIRNNLPAYADEILARARAYYEQGAGRQAAASMEG